MKKYIKSAIIPESGTIFEDEYFVFTKTAGRGINNTPWTGLKVVSRSLAEKHVVYIRLDAINNPRFEGQPVEYEYRNAHVSHGMRSSEDTLDETEEYIAVLEDAVDFAKRVNTWLFENYEGVNYNELDEDDIPY